jgi:peroxiredoxin Q/BCP
MPLKIGELAPDFTLETDTTGETVTLSQFKGQFVVLYFYPKDHTPGCTQQACDFRDFFPDFKKLGITVFGISKDSSKTHAQFKQKHNLPFSLLVDDKGTVCEAYGAFKEKSIFGKTFLGINRSTILIDANGIVRAIWRNVKVPGHVEQVLDAIKQNI